MDKLNLPGKNIVLIFGIVGLIMIYSTAWLTHPLRAMIYAGTIIADAVCLYVMVYLLYKGQLEEHLGIFGMCFCMLICNTMIAIAVP